MSHSILLTGGSGYLGGTLLARLKRDELPKHKAIYALVRSTEQADAVKQYGVEPLHLDLDNQENLSKKLVELEITVVFFLIDAFNHGRQLKLIKALAQVKSKVESEVHFLHTTGAKIFSEHAGMPVDRTFSDNDPDLYNLQKTAKAPIIKAMDIATETNNVIIETAEQYGVRSYIFIPCIVYGPGEGFGNKISIQTVAVVKAAKALGRVYDVNDESALWPICHVIDNTLLYRDLLTAIVAGKDIDYGKNGYYLASSGSVKWRDLYEAMAQGLATREAIANANVLVADDEVLGKMGKALVVPKEMVRLQLGGHCSLVAKHGEQIGWKPQHAASHILEVADAEVDLILENSAS